MIEFGAEVEAALNVLRSGGVILYPTDTVWSLGCDATNEEAIQTIYRIKERDDRPSLIVLAAGERDVLHYVAAPDLAVFDFIETQSKPTTVIFDNAVNFPPNLVAADGSIALRIVRDEFCRHLIKRLRKPIVSAPANSSGQPAPNYFADVSDEIKSRVDHVVHWRQDDKTPSQPSQVIRWNGNGTYAVIEG